MSGMLQVLTWMRKEVLSLNSMLLIYLVNFSIYIYQRSVAICQICPTVLLSYEVKMVFTFLKCYKTTNKHKQRAIFNKVS